MRMQHAIRNERYDLQRKNKRLNDGTRGGLGQVPQTRPYDHGHSRKGSESADYSAEKADNNGAPRTIETFQVKPSWLEKRIQCVQYQHSTEREHQLCGGQIVQDPDPDGNSSQSTQN